MRLSLPVRLGLLFGALYFLQGLVEPGDGLIAQPTRARLERWGWDAAQVAGASLLTALPWSLKPLYGLLSDAVPLLGSRRRGWLALVSGVAALALAIVALAPADSGLVLVVGLAVATMAVAFADVVVDAHMVEVAQPRQHKRVGEVLGVVAGHLRHRRQGQRQQLHHRPPRGGNQVLRLCIFNGGRHASPPRLPMSGWEA